MISRPKLSYHPDGHPVLSRAQIDDYAEALLSAHFPDQLCKPSPINPAELITLAHDSDGVTTIPQDLGHDGGRKRLGRTYLKRKVIALDLVLFQERQVSLPFVMAHELGHWLLHRDCPVNSIKQQEQLPDDNEDIETFEEPDLIWTPLRWLEWQANTFAAALLVPRKAAIRAIWSVQSDLGIATQKGIVYENATPMGQCETEDQLDRIAKLFNISKTLTRIRLRKLNLYQRQKDEPLRRGTAHNPFSSGLSSTLR
jgi:Zn-dependent peptidase ImmA (M78 family)